jgi:hypothetical protein
MGFSMTTLATISLLSFLAGSLPLAALLAYQIWMSNSREEKWMRIFSVKSLEIPATTMEGEEPGKTPLKPDMRKRLTVPLGVPDFAKDVYRAVRRDKSA